MGRKFQEETSKWYIWSIALHGVENWTLWKVDLRFLESFETLSIQTNRVRNEVLR
jgi:hypothetical protein